MMSFLWDIIRVQSKIGDFAPVPNSFPMSASHSINANQNVNLLLSDLS